MYHTCPNRNLGKLTPRKQDCLTVFIHLECMGYCTWAGTPKIYSLWKKPLWLPYYLLLKFHPNSFILAWRNILFLDQKPTQTVISSQRMTSTFVKECDSAQPETLNRWGLQQHSGSPNPVSQLSLSQRFSITSLSLDPLTILTVYSWFPLADPP